MSRRVPIIVYHHVYPDDHRELAITTDKKASGVITVSEFRRQMDYVLENGWQVVSTTEIVDWLEGVGTLPEKAVALHFDNGWLDTRTVVLPILDELGAAGTCYVISEPTDASSKGLPAGITTTTEGFVVKPFLTWDNCRQLIDAGWEIGAHTATHPKLGQVYDVNGEDALMAEIVPSNGVFEDNLGYVPDHFAYPSGSRSDVALPLDVRSTRMGCSRRTTARSAAGRSISHPYGTSPTRRPPRWHSNARTSTTPSRSSTSRAYSMRRWRVEHRVVIVQWCGSNRRTR